MQKHYITKINILNKKKLKENVSIKFCYLKTIVATDFKKIQHILTNSFTTSKGITILSLKYGK